MQKTLCGLLVASCTVVFGQKIDRQAVVGRHDVHLTEPDTLCAFTLGNGRFAMTFDVTGLQTFPESYQKGIPLGTQSEWGWHSFPNSENYRIEETLQPLLSNNREVPYARQWPDSTRAGKAANYLRQNPHRIHLATVGWEIEKTDGSLATISDIKNIDQTLNLWNGELRSRFEVEGEEVEVVTIVSQQTDLLVVKISSKLVGLGRIGLNLNYPYPSDQFLDEAVHFDFSNSQCFRYNIINSKTFSIKRQMDSTVYFTTFNSNLQLQPPGKSEKGFFIKPKMGKNSWEFGCSFSENETPPLAFKFSKIRKQVNQDYNQFWQSGGMIDFGETTDTRAAELERRMVLSLYLTHVNCGGSTPPQETGLTYNSWYGKPHMEMAWWHGVHFALWGRPQVLEQQMEWYFRAAPVAKQIAECQGFDGVRWQKMTDPWGGETASSVGSYLIWQEPHFIYFSELLRRTKGKDFDQKKYLPLLEQTAEFMADFVSYDSLQGRYILGPGIIPAQERFDPATTFNPTFELAYWRWALETAQKWRERAGEGRLEKWDAILGKLSPLPQANKMYLATENAQDCYEIPKYMTDHPAVLGAFGMLPLTEGLDEKIMQNTFEKVWKNWHWDETWGWDFPLTAMTASRLGYPERAVEALLMPVTTNTYLKNGHNYQTGRLRLYLPGNGGLLTALAMMATGTDDGIGGFPKNWKLRYEGLSKLP
ncbi:MAG: hypothetical protein GC192_21055 [Bacteroidetes bacterium]|nr:hypothetical protein [Bacteroidota bacterium]